MIKHKNFYNFWKNESVFLTEIKHLQKENKTYILSYNNIKEETKLKNNYNYIITNFQQNTKFLNINDINHNNITLYDEILNEKFLITKISNTLLLKQNFHYKKNQLNKQTIRKLFKLLNISKFFKKFIKHHSLMKKQYINNYKIDFKISKNVIDKFLIKFLDKIIKNQLKQKNLKLYGIILAIIPFKGIVLSIGHIRFFMPIGKLTDRQTTKVLHIKQCQLFINYFSNNLINFKLLKPYKNSKKKNRLILISHK